MTTTTEGLIRSTTTGEQRWFYGGGVHTWLARSEETGGAFLMFEDEVTQGKSTPLHRHPLSDETFYVLDGEIVVHLDGADHTVTTGGVAFAPRGLPHAFKVLSPRARILCLHTPGCCQGFYLDASDPLTDSTDRRVDLGRLRAAAADDPGIDLLGPPPFTA